MAGDVVERELRFDLSQGEVGARRRTPQGGLIVDANISRTGVLDYVNPDGSRRRELRHPDDVFKKESLDSFAHAPLTVDHPAGLVTPDSYLRVAPVGHVGATVAKDGKFVSAELHIQDAETIRKIESGELRELSCGYTCKLVDDSGSYDGKSHDARQTNIVGNHVAIGGKGWGRAGPEVRVHLDGGVSVSGVDPSYVRAAMAVKDDKADQGAADKGSAGTKTETAGDGARSDAGDALRGEIAVIKAENERLRADAQKRATDESEAKTQERIDKAVSARVTLVAVAAPILAAEGVKDWRADGKTDDAIKREVLAKLEPRLDLPDAKADGAGAFVEGAFRAAVTRADRTKDAFREMADVTGRPHDSAHADAKKDEDEDEVEDARQGLKDRMKDAWKPKGKLDREKDAKDKKKDRGRK